MPFPWIDSPARPRRSPERFRRSGRRGVTLVELIVAVAVATAVAGLILGILIQSNKEADVDLRRASLVSAASSTLQNIAQWAERSRSASTTTGEIYEVNHLGLNSRDPVTGAPGFFEVQPGRQESKKKVDTVYRWRGTGEKAPSDQEGWVSYGGESKVWLTVAFRYAWEFKGVEPQWSTGKPGEGRPRAMQMTVLAQDPDGRVPAVRLVTEVALQPSGKGA